MEASFATYWTNLVSEFSLVSNLLFQVKFESSFLELKHRLRNESVFSGIEIFFKFEW